MQDNSRILLQKAMKALEEADVREWCVGGGTVLAARYKHRLSKDIDVFITDNQLLAKLSPRFNSITEDSLDYAEEAKYISLTLPEGKIDFIVGGQVSKFIPCKGRFLGEYINLEDSVEIISKKIFFRGDRVFARDIFDIATVYSSCRKKDLIETMVLIPKQFKLFQEAYNRKISQKDFVVYSEQFQDLLLKKGKEIQGEEIQLCNDFLRDVEECLLK